MPLIGFPRYPSAFPLAAAAFLALLAAIFAGTDTAQAQSPPNNPATGTPAISGTARVGELLTVDTTSIADADGLTNATFSYDWLADDGPVPVGDLARLITTENVYRIRPDDAGLAIKVQVGFTDDAGNVEVLSSATTATVVASEPAPPENFTALPGEPGELDLEWEAPSFDPTTGGLRTSTIGDGGSPHHQLHGAVAGGHKQRLSEHLRCFRGRRGKRYELHDSRARPHAPPTACESSRPTPWATVPPTGPPLRDHRL